MSPGQTGCTPGGVPPKFFMFVGFFFPNSSEFQDGNGNSKLGEIKSQEQQDCQVRILTRTVLRLPGTVLLLKDSETVPAYNKNKLKDPCLKAVTTIPYTILNGGDESRRFQSSEPGTSLNGPDRLSCGGAVLNST